MQTQLNVNQLMKTEPIFVKESVKKQYSIYDAEPAIGIVYVVNNFLSGHVRLRGKTGGRYPFKYLEMIEALFGKANNVIEVCSGSVKGDINTTTVDLHIGKFDNMPDVVDDAEVLRFIHDEKFDRWRCDPPYNEETARKMYHCKMPNLARLLKAGARVVMTGSLLFLLCAQNYQVCPQELQRIGMIYISIIPNNEFRVLNIYYKTHHDIKFWSGEDAKDVQLRFDQIGS